MSQQIDYGSITVPSDKPPTEYTYAERRAEILELIKQAGHPGLLNKTELARRYDCTDPNIHNDIDVLAGYVVEAIDETEFDATATLVFDKAVREFVDRGEYAKAVDTIDKQSKWLARRGHVQDEPDRIEVEGDHEVRTVSMSSEAAACIRGADIDE